MITVQDGALLHIQGDFTNQGGVVNNDGLIEIGGNWRNLVADNPLDTSDGLVSFVGDNQSIGGSFNTLFSNLSFQNAQRVRLDRTIGIGTSLSLGSSLCLLYTSPSPRDRG